MQLSDGSIFKVVHLGDVRRLLCMCMWIVSFDHSLEDAGGNPQLPALSGVY